MITMEIFGKIKRMYTRDKKSLHQISKQTGLSRNTIRKWVRDTTKTGEPEYRRKECPANSLRFTKRWNSPSKQMRCARNSTGAQRVSPRLYPTQVCVVVGDAVVASHERASDRDHTCYDWQHYIALVQRKPGALRNGAPFAYMPQPLLRLRQGLMKHAGGDQVIAQVLAAVPTAGLEAVLVAVDLVIESGVLRTHGSLISKASSSDCTMALLVVM